MYWVAILAAILNFSSMENFPNVYHQKSVSTGFSVNSDIQFAISSLICTRENISPLTNSFLDILGLLDTGAESMNLR